MNRKPLVLAIVAIIGILSKISTVAVAAPITRGEMAAKIVDTYENINICKLSVPLFNVPPFDDVSYDTEHRKEIYICYGCDFMLGTANRIFEPHSNLTRAQAIVIIDRIIKNSGVDDKLTPVNKSEDKFNDDKDIPEWAIESIYSMKKYDFIVGDENNKFNPNQLVSLEHIDSILNRIQTAVVGSQEYPKNIFSGIFGFELPTKSTVLNYDFYFPKNENMDLSYIAKISVDKDGLFDVMNNLEIESVTKINKLNTSLINKMHSSYIWWDLTEDSNISETYIDTNGAVGTERIFKWMYVVQNEDSDYTIYLCCTTLPQEKHK